MLVDKYLPEFHFIERHSISANAPIHRAYEATKGFDLRKSGIIRGLLTFRGFTQLFNSPKFREDYEYVGLAELIAAGFILLEEDSPYEFVLGLVGRFWQLSGDMQYINKNEFIRFDREGFAKAVWSFSLTELKQGSVELLTETRIQCLGDSAYRKFRRYWYFIRPFSGMIRKNLLRLIKAEVEGTGYQK